MKSNDLKVKTDENVATAIKPGGEIVIEGKRFA
jgi:hypothetical protein